VAVCIAVAVLPSVVAAKPQAAEYKVLSTEFAASALGWRPEPPATGSLLFIAPDEYAPASRAGDQFRESRDKYADALFELAKRAAAAGQLSLAFQWATETVRENPAHVEARRVLGYELHDGQWFTPYGVRMADAGKIWHPKLGWIAAVDLPRYEAGERLVGGRWVSADVDAERHADIQRGWQVRTDHFLVTTNHSLAAAAELAARLERLHQVWRQLFAGFYLPEHEVRQLFIGERQARGQTRPFRVYYHRNRDDYSAALRRRQPRIGETLGIYFDANREAHFFAGDSVEAGGSPAFSTGEPPVATLYHEAVHQLFQESRPATKMVGNLANFWIVEGVATYFESLTEHDDPTAGLYFTVGEATAGRLPSARERLLVENFYVPLAQLNQMGKNDLQRHAEIAKVYSQAAGLAAFLMDADAGRYREPLVAYLTAVYAGRDEPDTLAAATGLSNEALDAAYRRFMESLP
jgi:hypothetical protein